MFQLAVRRWIRRSPAFWSYLLVVGVLLAGSALAPIEFASELLSVITVSGVAALGIGIYRQQPDIRVGWWLVFAAMGTGTVAAIAVTEGFPITGRFRPVEWLIASLGAISYLLLLAGLGWLGRLGGRTAAADMLDAAVIGLAVFLVLFALVISPILPPTGMVAAPVVLSLGAILAFAMAVRIILSVGIPTVSLGLLLLAVGALVLVIVSILAPSLTAGQLQTGWATAPLWVTGSVLLGAAGLHHSLRRTIRFRRPLHDPLTSRRRVVLFAVLAVLAPLLWSAEIRAATGVGYAALGVMVPIVVSAALMVLVVLRLGMMAEAAERQSADLRNRSRALTAAVEEQESLHRQLRFQSLHDPLTGLSNRVRLTERMEWALTRRAGSRQHALAIIGLDNFKNVNETMGHTVGDELLVEASQRLLGALPEGGTLARLGGDEFAVLLEDTARTEAWHWVERARELLRQPYRMGGGDVFLSGSAGLFTTSPTEPMPTPAEALRDADLALYAAKSAGRDRIVGFRPELREARMDWNRLSSGLRRALAGDELTLLYQPFVNLVTGEITGVEALLRWHPPGGPAVSPSDFIPVAEETGLIRPVGAWVVRRACRDARRWYWDHGVSVSVNVSGRQLEDPCFADMVERALRSAGLPGRALILEITESSLVTTATASQVTDQLHRLRGQQIRIAIDDFGTGYSSLAYISRLPADIVKIDSSFVQHPDAAGIGAENRDFTRAIFHMVEALDLEAIAEGVETLAQAEALRELRCPQAQGFLFAKPMPRELVEQALVSANQAQRV